MGTIMFEPAGPDDAAAIADLHRRLFDPPWDAAGVAALMAPPTGFGWVGHHALPGEPAAECPSGKARTLLAFFLARVAAGEAEILSIAVAPGHQRHGLARSLFRHAIPELAARGATRLFLEVAADNTAALALYRGLGFTEVGRRRAYYARRNAAPVDALVLARDL